MLVATHPWHQFQNALLSYHSQPEVKPVSTKPCSASYLENLLCSNKVTGSLLRHLERSEWNIQVQHEFSPLHVSQKSQMQYIQKECWKIKLIINTYYSSNEEEFIFQRTGNKEEERSPKRTTYEYIAKNILYEILWLLVTMLNFYTLSLSRPDNHTTFTVTFTPAYPVYCEILYPNMSSNSPTALPHRSFWSFHEVRGHDHKSTNSPTHHWTGKNDIAWT